MEAQLAKIGDLLVVAFREELKEQGHFLTGRLNRSIEARIRTNIVQIFANDYALYLDSGVKPNRIPFGGGGGKSSQYIQGLMAYAMQRFKVNAKEATKIAFAIANVQKRQGMPTKRSFRFSKNGKRTGFIEAGAQKVESQILDILISIEDEINFDI